MIIELVFRGSATTRPDIIASTGLTGATVTRLLTGLLKSGLVSETADRVGSVGQPRRTLAITPKSVYSAGVNFMRGRFDLALVDMSGGIIDHKSHEIGTITPESLTELSTMALSESLERTGIDRSLLAGVGFSVPGNFAPDGVSLRAHDYFQALDGQNLKPGLEEALDLPCFLETDGACAAVGEFLHGVGRQHNSVFMIHIGHGLGGGAVIGGNLFRGSHGNSSKPGALFPYETPRPSGQDLIENLRDAGAPVSDIADLEALDAKFETALDSWLDRAAGELGEALRLATAFLDPELVVLGGRLPNSFNALLTERIKSLDLVGPSRGLPVAPIVASTLGPKSGALGAASIPIFEGFFPGPVGSRHNAYIDGRRG